MTARCPDCGHVLDDVPVGNECPGCGGTRRDTEAHHSAVLGFTAIPTPTIELAYNPTPGWTQQWSTVQYHLSRLRKQYSGDPLVGNQEMGETVVSLMIALWHVHDWLKTDESIPQELQELNHLAAKPVLARCNAYANTAKHAKPHPGKPTARNHRYTSDGPKMSIECDGEVIDALDLAEQCERAWRELLTEHGVPIP